MSYVPDKGDIVLLNFDPSAGQEIIKRRPALVISRQQFNDHTDFAIVAPITSTRRGIALEVVLSGTHTEGAVLIHQLRSLDFISRQAEFVEKAPADVVKRATNLALAIIR